MHFSMILLVPVALAMPLAQVEKRQAAGDYGQCGGEGWSIGCNEGWHCETQNQYYSQCLPDGTGFTKRQTVGDYGQCGGEGWSLGCNEGWHCETQNQYYSQCLPDGTGFTKRQTVGEYGQCGGEGWSLGCNEGWHCEFQNPYYSQCLPDGTGFTKRDEVGEYGQCAGEGWSMGCIGGWNCVFQNQWYSQCLPEGSGFTKRKAEPEPVKVTQTSKPAEAVSRAVEVFPRSTPGVKSMRITKRQEGPSLYGQCAGQGWSTGCADGTTCTFQNEWYSQCL